MFFGGCTTQCYPELADMQIITSVPHFSPIHRNLLDAQNSLI